MTGDMAGEGQGLERAVRMAVADEAEATGLPPVEIVVLDDKADPFEAASVARRATDDPAVFAVIGHMTSGCDWDGFLMKHKRPPLFISIRTPMETFLNMRRR